MRKSDTFRTLHPLSWLFHQNTMRNERSVVSNSVDPTPKPSRESLDATFTALTNAKLGSVSYSDLLLQRMSCRSFANREITLDQLSILLATAYGQHGSVSIGSMELPERPVPSGGALYPLEVTVIVQNVKKLQPGLYHYLPSLHGLECVSDKVPTRPLLEYLFVGQKDLLRAPVVMVLSAVFERSLGKYGDRGYRYVLIESGHVAQNINLTALALELGSCNIGGFFDRELSEYLEIDPEYELPLYATVIGYPENTGRVAGRGI